MYGIGIGILLTPSLGTLYSLTPIILIIIFIAAAAGLSTGRSIFDTFGIGALLGLSGSAGRGGVGKGFQAATPSSTSKFLAPATKGATPLLITKTLKGAVTGTPAKAALAKTRLNLAAQQLSKSTGQNITADSLKSQTRDQLLQSSGMKMAVAGAGALGVSAYLARRSAQKTDKLNAKVAASQQRVNIAADRVNAPGGDTVSNKLKLSWATWRHTSPGTTTRTGGHRLQGSFVAAKNAKEAEDPRLTNLALASAYAQLTPAERIKINADAKKQMKESATEWQKKGKRAANSGFIGAGVSGGISRLNKVSPNERSIAASGNFAHQNPATEAISTNRHITSNDSLAASQHFGLGEPGHQVSTPALTPAKNRRLERFQKTIPQDVYDKAGDKMQQSINNEKTARDTYKRAWKKSLNQTVKAPEQPTSVVEERTQRRLAEKEQGEEEARIRERREIERKRSRKSK